MTDHGSRLRALHAEMLVDARAFRGSDPTNNTIARRLEYFSEKLDALLRASASALSPEPAWVQVDYSCMCSNQFVAPEMRLTHCDVHRDGWPIRLRQNSVQHAAPVALSPSSSPPANREPLPGCAECGWNDVHSPQCSLRGTLAPPARLPRARTCHVCKQMQLMALSFCGHCGARY